MVAIGVLLFVCVSAVFGLECGINVNGSEEQFRELTNLCAAGNKTEVTEKPKGGSSDEDEDDEESQNG